MFRRTRPIRFVYAEQYRESGSTVMRGRQLREIAARSMPERDIRYVPLESEIRRSTVFLTKGALKAMTMQRLETLRAAGNVLLFDVVDEVPPPITQEYADGIVAASVTAFLDLSRDYPHLPVHLVNHHVDPRIEMQTAPAPNDRFRAGYFGERINAVLTPAIEADVTVVHIDTSREEHDWLSRLPEFNFHYAVRATRELDHHKPFLKGFTAAHRGANILIQSSQREALHWLGDDYPYLLREAVTEETVLAALSAARETFGGPVWHEALGRMHDIRERTSSRRIGLEVRSLCALIA